MVKKLVIALLVAVLLAGLAWVVLFKVLGGGKAGAEAWVAKQLMAIADDHLNPTLKFSKLLYTFPKTVTLSEVSLTDHDVSIITADSITIEFARLPAKGRPVVLQTVEFDTPVVRLIEQSDGSLQGLTDLVKSSGGQAEDDGGSTRLSDVLAITLIRIANGKLSYEPQGKPPMVLDPLTFDMNHTPPKTAAAEGQSFESGWYGYEASMTLEPVVKLVNKARLNLDNGDLDIESLTLDMSLDEKRYQVFTPDIQGFLKEHGIVGKLHGVMSGLVSFDNLSKTSLTWHVNLTGASATVKGHTIPVQSMDMDGSYKEMVLDFPKIDANAFSGHLDAKARFDYASAGRPFTVSLDGKDMRLEDVMHYDGESDADFKGDTAITATVSGDMSNLRQTLTGTGHIDITKARLAMVEFFGKALNKIGGDTYSDQAHLDFEIHGDRVHFTREIFLGTVIGIKGKGDTYYDGRLNHVVTAGPVERLTGDLKGPIGFVVETLSGAVVKYQMTGTLEDPKLRVLPLGLGEKRVKGEE